MQNRNALVTASALILLSSLSACTHLNESPSNDVVKSVNSKNAKNVILFVGDGMGVSTVTAIRILDGQKRGATGEENTLSWETFPNVALSKTYNTNQQVADSAGTATAMMTGVKTKAGFISISDSLQRGECPETTNEYLPTLLEQFESNGKSTGIVTTARVTHATPATAYAHVTERDWESISDMPNTAIQAGCTDIASQLIDIPRGDGIEVVLGGGRSNFLPQTTVDPEYKQKTGNRSDGRNLAKEWANKTPGTNFVWNLNQFDNIDPNQTERLLGLFEPGHMQFELERNSDEAGEPSLSDMTRKALQILQKNDAGYFLMVEAGRIDHGHHKNQATLALHDGIEMAEAVALTDKLTNDEDTLIIVTADHSHVFTLAGYPTRGNPILGKVIGNDSSGNPKTTYDLGDDGLPYTTLGYQNGPGAVTQHPRPDISSIDTQSNTYKQQALMPRSSETHAGEDVAIYAKGPGSENIRGVMEQNKIYDVMAEASAIK